MPDFVDQTDPTDQNPDSIGAGMAFLSWLMSQGYSLGQIAPAMVSLGTSGTLAQLYANLTGNAASNAWPNFQAAVQNLPNGVTDDDPFNAMSQAA
jgi:NADH:ubiquinone oxidoreductase subunit D